LAGGGDNSGTVKSWLGRRGPSDGRASKTHDRTWEGKDSAKKQGRGNPCAVTYHFVNAVDGTKSSKKESDPMLVRMKKRRLGELRESMGKAAVKNPTLRENSLKKRRP